MRHVASAWWLVMVLSASLCAQEGTSIFDDAVFEDLQKAAEIEKETTLAVPSTPRALPDKSQIEAAQKRLNELVPVHASRGAAQEKAYFDVLGFRAAKLKDETALLYAMLEVRLSVALHNRWLAETLRCSGELRRQFRVDETSMYGRIVTTLAPTDAKEIGTLLDVLHAAITRATVLQSSADPKDVASLVDSARLLAAKLTDAPAKASAASRVEQARTRMLAWTSARAAWPGVQAGTGSAKEKGLVGAYLCFHEENWDVGLKYLAESDDAASRVAKLDLASDLQKNGKRVGDAWWDASNVAVKARQPAMRRRAAHWYHAELPSLARDAKAQIERRIADATPAPVDDFDPESAIPPGPAVVLVLDGTGTMVGLKFELLRREVSRFLDTAPASTRVGIVLFTRGDDRGVEAVDKTRLLVNSPENRKRIGDLLERFGPGGSTNPMPAMELAFRLKPQHIVMLTDGEFDNLVQYDEVVRHIGFLNADRQVRISAIMFADRDEKAAKALRDIADANGGKSRFVSVDQLLR